MDISKTLKGVAMAGLPNVLLALRYSQQRDRWEKRYPVPEIPDQVTRPGKLKHVEGMRLVFEQADLTLDFLTPNLVRLTWQPGREPVPYALARTEWPGAEVTVAAQPAQHRFLSSDLQVTVWADGSVHFAAGTGQVLSQHLPPERRGVQWSQRWRLAASEKLYGLGERAAGLNLRGGRYQLWNQDAGGIYTTGQDPLYLSIPLVIGHHADGSYLVFHENTHQGWLDARPEQEAEMGFVDGALRYYFIAGPLPQLLETYTALTGRPPLPPRWALGYHHSVVAYKTEAEVQAAAQGMEQHQLPISVLHLDLDYMEGYRTFTIDTPRFPHLKQLAADLDDQGIKLVTIIDTAVKVDPAYAVYREGSAIGAFCRLPDGAVLQGPVWPGWAVFPDFTDAHVRTWWGRYYSAFLETGIRGFWHDMNEPAVFTAWGDRTAPLPTRHALEGRNGDHREAHNVYALQMNRAGFEALRRLRPTERPWLLTRAGFAGIQRYAWSWTGDTACEWSALRQTVPTVLGLGLSGAPYTGPDTGGFHGNPSPELYTRWFQLSSFLPFFRTMSAFTTPRREPWHFDEPALTIARAFLELRYRLLPFWYTLAWQTSQSGHPLVRPLSWMDQTDPALWEIDDAFLLGDAWLVAPILAEGAQTRSVTLPAGRWFSFWDNLAYHGPTRVEVPAPLDRLPLFVRAGTVLPIEESPGYLALHVYVPASGPEQVSYLYLDAGDGYGDMLLSTFRVRWVDHALEVSWERTGTFPWPYTEIEVHIHGARVESAQVDADPLAGQNHWRLSRPFERLNIQVDD